MNTCRAPQLKMSPKPLTKATKISRTMIATSSQIKSNQVIYLFFSFFFLNSIQMKAGVEGGEQREKEKQQQRNKNPPV